MFESGLAKVMIDENGAVSLDEARRIIRNSLAPLPGENISLLEAEGRVLYEDVVSDIMMPPLDDSLMDGYALRAADTRGASAASPKKLRVLGESRAGGLVEGQEVSKGCAVRIMTGAAMPRCADAVVPFEDAVEQDGQVIVFKQAVKNQYYRRAGDNLNKGDRVLSRGDRLTPADVGILASLNKNRVKVHQRPLAAVISTGDELADIGDEIRYGQIRNVNAYTLQAELKKLGAIPVYMGIARDTVKDTREKFLKAMKSDVVISTGGVSMGRYDYIKDVYSDLDVEILFDRVNIKPGGPCTFGRKDKKLFFGLPGRPVSTLTSFIQFARPAILGLMGAKRTEKPIVSAILEEDLRMKAGRMHLIRGCFTIKNEKIYVSRTGRNKSSVYRSMSDANCLIITPENVSNIKAGEKVSIQLIDHEEI